MPQITEMRKNNAVSLVRTFFKLNGVLKRCFDAIIEAKNTLVRMKFFSQEYLTHFFTQNMQTM